MPRLDAERIALLRQLCVATDSIERQIDADLVEEFGISLRWFEVMAALQRAGGTLRVSELCAELDEVASSLSRRLDRMEEAGHVERESTPTAGDRRSVSVHLTRDGRSFWRDANVIYRRSVQRNFAQVVTESDIVALQRLLSKLAR
jgi:DNA-binding MarR family transcriptional regulator